MTSYMVHGVVDVDVRFVKYDSESMGWAQITVRCNDGSTHDVTLFNSGDGGLFDRLREVVKAAEVQS